MKSISKVLAATLILANLSLVTLAQDKKQEQPKKAKTEKKMKMKDHVCTQACHDSGKHVYAHGEKGHVCTDACKKG
ncbi:hypothetical protein A4D02_35310 [Niastella koreensis]|uniref:Uncharacterized protein n=2 Tax=Niastella koreensis TaxID=354356 RepID=G8TBT4_NIAKG|nr:hypothetical protein [Niastella koreensis]AEV98216.1 hypothetical protein Niako_1858 [Niastella koreensis GR20-10]OQP44325.1 hypothetical protein A4D02_35310 [Niastella koreensis]